MPIRSWTYAGHLPLQPQGPNVQRRRFAVREVRTTEHAAQDRFNDANKGT